MRDAAFFVGVFFAVLLEAAAFFVPCADLDAVFFADADVDAVVFLAAAFFAVDFLPAGSLGVARPAARWASGLTRASSAGASPPGLPGRAHAALQGRHQVEHLAARRGRGGLGERLAGRLGGDDLLDGLAVLVVKVLEVDLAEGVHQGVREIEFLVADGDVGVGCDALGRADLVRPEQPVHGDGVTDHPQHPQPLPAAQRELGDGDLVAALERLAQQGVRLGGGGTARREVVRRVHLERIDPVARHEGHDLDRPGGRDRQLGQVLVADRDDRAVRVLVPLADLRPGDLAVLQLAELAVADPAAVLGVDLAERDRVALGGVHQLDRDADQAERDGAVPDGSHIQHLSRQHQHASYDFHGFRVILIV
ncbi:hypothetical protein GCM10020295_26180 [Streptomyces cinereospinus]